MAKKTLTRIERLIKSLNTKKTNLERKRKNLKEEFDLEMAEITEQIEVIKLQLQGLEK